MNTNTTSASPGFRVFMDPSAIIVEPGQSTGNITIEVENVPELYSWEMNITWDPSLLSFGGLFINGGFLSSQISAGTFFVKDMSGIGSGWIKGSETGMGNEEAVGSGTLAKINFTVVANGECAIDIHQEIFVHLSPAPNYDLLIYSPEDYTLEDGAFRWPPLLGDINKDGIVNVLDLVTIAIAYGTSTGDPLYNPDADIASPYGYIDIADLARCALDYGKYV